MAQSTVPVVSRGRGNRLLSLSYTSDELLPSVTCSNANDKAVKIKVSKMVLLQAQDWQKIQ